MSLKFEFKSWISVDCEFTPFIKKQLVSINDVIFYTFKFNNFNFDYLYAFKANKPPL